MMTASTSLQATGRQGVARAGHPLLADPVLRWVAVVGGCLSAGFALDLGSDLVQDRSRMLGWALTIAAGPVVLCLAGMGVAKLMLSGEPPFTRVAGVFGAAAAATSGVSSGLAPALAASNRQHWFFVLGVLANSFVVASARAQYLGVEAGLQGLPRRRRPYSVLPYVTVLAAYGLLVAGLRGHRLSPAGWMVVIGATACTCLVILRQLAAFTENARLLAERDQLTAELEYRAYHDGLTGLANRTLFFERAESALALARRTGATTAVALLDLDGFKPVNDLRGHHVGDAVLVATADRLRAHVRAGDLVARLGGDEFAILLGDIDPQVLEGLGERLRDGVSEPLEADGGPVQVGCSIGFALEPGHGSCDMTALVRAADEAMYAAKTQGRGAVVFQTREASAFGRA